MFKALVALLLLLVLVPCISQAKLLDDPQTVTYMEVDAHREGSVILHGTGIGSSASSLEIWAVVPQGTERQTVRLDSVEGPDDYRFDEDSFGNEVIVLSWKDPPLETRLDYSVSFDVNVWKRDDQSSGTDFPITGLTEPDEEIIEKAYDLTTGLTARKKFMELTSFVYDLVDYDKTYQNIQKSAEWVFENRRAVCDGHANLLISMLRSLGYNAYYVIGYAYSEEGIDPQDPNYWGSHGWVEVEHDGKAVSLDPTWLEAPVDATHIKFAIAPDSNYTEFAQVMAHNVELEWDKGEYRVDLMDYGQEPGIVMTGEVINPRPGSGESSLIINDVSSATDCALTDLVFSSCQDRGRDFFSSIPQSMNIGICGREKVYWLLTAPELDSGVQYVCGVSVTGSGERFNSTLKAEESPDYIGTRMSTPRVLNPGEIFNVNTTIENTGSASKSVGLYMMLGDYVQEHSTDVDGMQALDLVWTLRAPVKEGGYDLYFFDSSGGLVKEGITVTGNRSVEITDIDLPENVSMGESLEFNVSIRGTARAGGLVRVSIGDFSEDREFSIGEGETRTMAFTYVPKKEGYRHVSITVLSGDIYQDGMAGHILVYRDVGFWESVAQAIRQALESLFRALGMS